MILSQIIKQIWKLSVVLISILTLITGITIYQRSFLLINNSAYLQTYNIQQPAVIAKGLIKSFLINLDRSPERLQHMLPLVR